MNEITPEERQKFLNVCRIALSADDRELASRILTALSTAEYQQAELLAAHVVSNVARLERERNALADAIRTHRSQKADDRCIEDDDKLYAALGDGIKCDRRVGDKAAMLHNCQRFIEQRCEGGGWPSYAELERQLAAANFELKLRRRTT